MEAAKVISFKDHAAEEPNGHNPLIRCSAGHRVEITVGKQTKEHGCTAIALHAVTNRKVSENVHDISVGAWVRIRVHGIEVTVWRGLHGWCKPLRDAIKAEKDSRKDFTHEPPSPALVQATDEAAVALFHKVFALLNPEQIGSVLAEVSRQAFERGWERKQRQVSSLLGEILDSRAPREDA